MRDVLIANLPDTKSLTDSATREYAKLLNVELDNFNRNLNRYASKIVVSSVTSAKTLSANDELVLCNGTFTITLPPAGSSEGKVYYIKNIGSGTITIDGDNSDTIDDSANAELDAQYEFITITSDGSEWWIINSNL